MKRNYVVPYPHEANLSEVWSDGTARNYGPNSGYVSAIGNIPEAGTLLVQVDSHAAYFAKMDADPRYLLVEEVPDVPIE